MIQQLKHLLCQHKNQSSDADIYMIYMNVGWAEWLARNSSAQNMEAGARWQPDEPNLQIQLTYPASVNKEERD